LSASGWDEDNCMTTVDVEHYAEYVAVLSLMLIVYHLNLRILAVLILTLEFEHCSFFYVGSQI
jgi:hypothetical protein